MVGLGGGSVKAAALLLLGGGCFWHSYGRLAATHVDVLVGIARKGADLVASGRLTAESMPELTYPLERAQAFAARAHAGAGADPPASLVAFDALLVRYRDFVDALDRARRERSAGDAAAALAAPMAALETAADGVRAALRAERRV